MIRRMALTLAVLTGCAPVAFHGGQTSLRKPEQAILAPRKGAPKGGFERFWRSPMLRQTGLLQWDEDRSWACPAAPAELLRTMRDEVGRLNQQAGIGENLMLTVTFYRFDRGGIWSQPAAYYELVARNPLGQVVWAADDKIEAKREMALTLADTPSVIIAREMLRKIRREVGPAAMN